MSKLANKSLEWSASAATKPYQATMVIVHGMCEHKERYQGFATFLESHDIRVVLFDLPGHGKQAQENNSLGFFADHGGNKLVVRQVVKLINEVAKQYPEPLYLFGHSMGSFIVRCVLQEQGLPPLAGVVLSGTSGPAPTAIIARTIAATSSFWLGPRHYAHFVYQFMQLGNTRKIPQAPSKLSWLSKDLTEIEKYEKDPLCGFTFTASALRDLFDLMIQATGVNWEQRIVQQNLPFLLITGSQDRVGQWGKGVPVVAHQLNAGNHKVTLQLYPNGRHELLLDVEREVVMNHIFEWLGLPDNVDKCGADV